MENGDGEAASTPPPTHRPPSMPVREDCWTEEATETLVEAWGERYLDLNRGNLRQKHWQEVANAVNARHGHVKKHRRTDVQCKNRIDTLKKKYKIEKAKVSDPSTPSYTSPWPFFSRLDHLIGSSNKPPSLVMAATAPRRRTSPAPTPSPPLALLPSPSSVPVGRRSKRPPPAAVDDSYFRRNFSAMAAAAAAASAAEEEDEEDLESSKSRSSNASPKRDTGRDAGADGYHQLADAIERLGDIYKRVEEAKQRQLIELEKQRMQFAKDLEIQRIRLFMESQIQLEKIKRVKRSSDDDSYP